MSSNKTIQNINSTINQKECKFDDLDFYLNFRNNRSEILCKQAVIKADYKIEFFASEKSPVAGQFCLNESQHLI